METLTHGMTLTATPFISIFAAITIWWALADLSTRKLQGARSASRIFLAILLPPIGILLYVFSQKQQRTKPASYSLVIHRDGASPISSRAPWRRPLRRRSTRQD